MFALGWRGSARHWHRYETAYLLLAGISTPLVVSVHSIVSFDFAAGIIPGWHTTVFPPYFVAGAVFAGFAMVLTICIPLRRIYGLKDFITMHHIDNMARVMLTTGLIVLYGYLLEVWQGYYSANIYEEAVIENRFFGPYAWSYWALFLCNAMAIQFLWFEKIRLNTIAVWIIAMFVNVGMWLERFVIIVISLSRDFIPAEWANYRATWWDVSNYVGTIGLFFTLMFLFIRLLPVISIFEMRELVSRTAPATHDVDHHEPPRPSPTPAPSAAD
jgi:molybdopterin-containing oxidoreductase family membrane subunit